MSGRRFAMTNAWKLTVVTCLALLACSAPLRAQTERSRGERSTQIDGGFNPEARGRDRSRAGDEESDPRALRINPQLLPPESPGRRPQWFLGVRVDNLETGVMVTRVYPRSPAARAGLERDDVIVALDGYQIGYVNGQLYDLGTELQLRAGRRGDVRLLVQDHRSGGLRNVDVRLERSGDGNPGFPDDDDEEGWAVIAGRANLRTLQGALPFNATLTVRLVELSGAGRPSRPLAEDRITRPSSLPIPFRLRYDPSQMRRGEQYGVLAFIESYGRPLFRTRSPARVEPGQRTVEITLEPVR